VRIAASKVKASARGLRSKAEGVKTRGRRAVAKRIGRVRAERVELLVASAKAGDDVDSVAGVAVGGAGVPLYPPVEGEGDLCAGVFHRFHGPSGVGTLETLHVVECTKGTRRTDAVANNTLAASFRHCSFSSS
jgi:hypothetical protein